MKFRIPQQNQPLLLLFFFLVGYQIAFSQDLISKDGKNMGPRSYFIYACAYDENDQVRIDYQRGYSSLDFCNCLADDLIPQMTADEINYILPGNRHAEIYKNEVLSSIANDCMRVVLDKWKQQAPPPKVSAEVETITQPIVEGVIDSIIVIADYEKAFYAILDQQLGMLVDESTITEAQLRSIKQELTYEIVQTEVIFNAYGDFSEEELQAIYNYLRSLSPSELETTNLRYERGIIDYFTKLIELRLDEKLSEE